MKCSDITALLEKKYPGESAEDWDNVGLLAGDENSDVKNIMVALDATDEVVRQAVKARAQLLITHHPLIFGAVKQVNNKTIVGRRLLKLIGNNIAYYAMHTNFDIKAMAELNAGQIGLVNDSVLYEVRQCDGIAEGIGRVGELKEEMSYVQLARYVKDVLDIDSVRCYGLDDKKVRRVAISGGSGKSVVDSAINAGAQVLITGDIDYHTGIDAAANGLYIIDAGHFGTEKIFMDYMTRELRKMLPDCSVVKANQAPPFVTVF